MQDRDISKEGHGSLRIMANKVDVVEGLAKRCNENWSMAPKSDIVFFFLPQYCPSPSCVVILCSEK